MNVLKTSDFMEWIMNENVRLLILFAGLFLLSGLEYFFPLVKRNLKHVGSNLMLTALLLLLNLFFSSLTLFLSEWGRENKIGLFQSVHANTGIVIFSSILFLDLWAGYIPHRLLHLSTWFWKFHSVHHSDTMVDVTTAFRQHPVESVVRTSFQISGMVMLGIPLWVLMIYLTLSAVNAQIEHSNIIVPRKLDKILQYLVVTPNMHKIHHSVAQKENDTNFSNIFSIWDKIFGTYCKKDEYQSIRYGLDYLGSSTFSFWQLIKLPFTKKGMQHDEE
jgi:sterol desaturase/sphingolipid hydroxylase (fatty acid hydroxylase superfamily)